MTTEELIVSLARAAGPVQPLPRPLARLARWTAVSVPLMLLAIGIGARKDLASALSQPEFLAIALVTIATSLLSAASALVLAIPGAERSRWQRALPLLAGAAWIGALVYLLTAEGAAMHRVFQWPFHLACILEIAGFSLVPGWVLFGMLRRAAPLQLAWSGGLATLASVALAAAATQLICPIDDPAHHLVGHVLPVMVLTGLGTIAGHRYLSSMEIRSSIQS